MGQAHAIGDTRRAHADAQRQGIDEHAQGAFGACATLQAAQQDSAEHHLLAAAELRQYLRPSLVHQAGHAHAQSARLFAQLQDHLACDPLAGLEHLARTGIGVMQAEHDSRLVDIAQQLTEQRFVSLRIGAKACLGHIVAVGRAGVQHRLALQHGGDFRHQLLDRRMVEDDVVDQQRCLHCLPRGGLHQPNQRRLGEREPLARRGKLAGERRRVSPYHLHRFFERAPMDAGTQDVMASDDHVQGRGERVQLRLIGEAEARLQHVGVAVFAGQVVIEDALLQGRQAVDVLNVLHAAGNLRHQRVDGRLRKIRQWQQVRCDTGAVRRNRVGRHDDAALTTQRGSQRLQRRLAEQHTNVCLQPPLTQARRQGNRQQRMAAQLEEVVLSAHAVHAQQFGPEHRQQGFGLAQWCFEDALLGHVRGRQRLAVELAVGA
ncbi:non-ribosomal peptide synthetase, terminal component domain protein [Pseudomonas putida S610]|nr:non-ribosomal peptide synthetase, terminal component domain protein [Pseudomonas putida S610]